MAIKIESVSWKAGWICSHNLYSVLDPHRVWEICGLPTMYFGCPRHQLNINLIYLFNGMVDEHVDYINAVAVPTYYSDLPWFDMVMQSDLVVIKSAIK